MPTPPAEPEKPIDSTTNPVAPTIPTTDPVVPAVPTQSASDPAASAAAPTTTTSEPIAAVADTTKSDVTSAPSTVEPAKEPGTVTPPPPPNKASGSKNMMVLGIVAAVAILLGGVAAYNAILQSKSHVAAMNYAPGNAGSVAQANTSPTQQPASGQIDPKNTSDQSLQQDEQTVNSQVTQATADLNNADKSLNDQPDNLAQ
jgi:hypothetical protein